MTATVFVISTLVMLVAVLFLGVYCWHSVMLNRMALDQSEGWEAMYYAVCAERDELKDALADREADLADANESIEYLHQRIKTLNDDGEWWREGGDPPWPVG